ncbi:NADH:flavin oxidoreductase/NADH oxidase [Paenibacillus albiflavus]|uniref:NADH:flavin oxidoreductase/NADH oxidase n=1 Tax=Paenibacillus albiflavus TaxID=2545760 RepID=A0A4R4EDK4_9BACL|nr:NADH:flavin oxidoreductase/NADH oxidase [Paenibacillus albiflavus]TCZ77809.1 NADH:flavin oxidoreductase/NADH oxidase [Paenibacillus albiflavus]
MSNLSQPLQLKSLHLPNRIVMAPMCQYSAEAMDGMPTNWHYIHYVSRAIGGTGLIIIEMTDVEPDGRISNQCLGLWSDEHVPEFARIIRDAQQYGAKVGIQIAHAGRKAEDSLEPVGPCDETNPNRAGKLPRALTTSEVKAMVQKFQDAARRAVQAGVDTIEIHGAHGYLIHQFHSPAINRRNDEYGQDLTKFGVEVIQAIKSVLPEEMPLIMRVSAIEHMDGGYDINHAIEVCSKYQSAGVDVFHISTGGDGPAGKKIKFSGHSPAYQVPFARAIKQALNVPVIAVGNLDQPEVAESVLVNEDADLIAIGRGMLRDPYWAVHALHQLGDHQVEPVKQYKRGYPSK